MRLSASFASGSISASPIGRPFTRATTSGKGLGSGRARSALALGVAWGGSVCFPCEQARAEAARSARPTRAVVITRRQARARRPPESNRRAACNRPACNNRPPALASLHVLVARALGLAAEPTLAPPRPQAVAGTPGARPDGGQPDAGGDLLPGGPARAARGTR